MGARERGRGQRCCWKNKGFLFHGQVGETTAATISAAITRTTYSSRFFRLILCIFIIPVLEILIHCNLLRLLVLLQHGREARLRLGGALVHDVFKRHFARQSDILAWCHGCNKVRWCFEVLVCDEGASLGSCCCCKALSQGSEWCGKRTEKRQMKRVFEYQCELLLRLRNSNHDGISL